MLALVALLAAGCSDDGSAAREQANEHVAQLGDAIAEAIILSYQAASGEVEPQRATVAVAAVRTVSQSLAETAVELEPASQLRAQELVELANQALLWVAQTEYELAEKLRLEEFGPLAVEFAELPIDPGAPVVATSTTPLPRGTAITVLAVIAAVGVFLAIRYKTGKAEDPVLRARQRQAERSGATNTPKQRTWSEIPPLFTDDPGPTEEPVGDSDLNRSTKARAMEVDLKGLLMTALHQVKDYGWDMSIVCPDLHIMADPVKLRHAVLAALGNAFLSGAQRVGLVVEDLEGDVLLTIGRDAPPDEGEANEFAERFANQVQVALGVDQVESSLITDDEVSLMSVSLGRKIGANEVSEPVA
jgi:hypothetical protein